ncbi:RNA-binding domain-containing protein [Lichtheimia hyalospora FSU 10163]|nr:RNA-binding domain-containing protein [Lichtheimia hyalospora FSU 10163]
MASTLDKALDDVIKEKRSSRRSNDSRPKRSSGPSSSRGGGGGGGGIRKRNVGSSSRLGATFVRTVQLRGNAPSGGRRNVNQQWTHDLFDEDRHGNRSVASRLGPRGGSNRPGQGGSELLIENLHYNVVEKDLQDLFGMVGQVEKARITFDRSGRSTGTAHVRFARQSDAEKALDKYNNVELDGQVMHIQMAPARRGGGDRSNGGGSTRSSGNRGGRRGGRGRQGDGGSRKIRNEADLDEEMEAYMKSNEDGDADKMALD